MIEVEWFDAGGEVARFPDPLAFGPKMAKHGRLVNTPKWSKRV